MDSDPHAAPSPQTARPIRERAFGEQRVQSAVDRFGIWLSARQIRRRAGGLSHKRLGDFGCGYQASFVRSVLGEIESAVIVDVSLADDLVENPKISAYVGPLPDALSAVPDASVDVVLCISVLEHLDDPLATLLGLRRIVAGGGVCIVNVPTWRGKRFLELASFRLGLSPPEEMDDHRRYYDPRDLWPLLVEAGFRPRDIKCFRHKFGLNTFAVCRAPQPRS